MVIAVNARYNSNCNRDYGDHKVTIEIMFINQSRKSLSNKTMWVLLSKGFREGAEGMGLGGAFT